MRFLRLRLKLIRWWDNYSEWWWEHSTGNWPLPYDNFRLREEARYKLTYFAIATAFNIVLTTWIRPPQLYIRIRDIWNVRMERVGRSIRMIRPLTVKSLKGDIKMPSKRIDRRVS